MSTIPWSTPLALGMTPRQAFGTGFALTGDRPQRLIPYTEDFIMATLPTTPKGTAKVDGRLGVKIRYVWYWSDAFRESDVHGKQVPVRFDPFDAGTAHAFVKGRWVRCVSEHHSRFMGRTEREMMLAAEELRRQSRQHVRQAPVTARRLADFLASVEAEQTLLPQRLQDAKARVVLNRIQGGFLDSDAAYRTVQIPTPNPDLESAPHPANPAVGKRAVSAIGPPVTVYTDY
jgi:putative transposase